MNIKTGITLLNAKINGNLIHLLNSGTSLLFHIYKDTFKKKYCSFGFGLRAKNIYSIFDMEMASIVRVSVTFVGRFLFPYVF